MNEPQRAGSGGGQSGAVLDDLARVIASRRAGSPASSYVARLLAGAPDAVLKKIGEEATETVLAAKDGDRGRIVSETADLWFHCLVMLAQYDLHPDDVLGELQRRAGISGLDEKAARRAAGRVDGAVPPGARSGDQAADPLTREDNEEKP